MGRKLKAWVVTWIMGGAVNKKYATKEDKNKQYSE